MKTADLIGPALDWAVAKADGWKDSQLAALRKYRCDFSTNWAQGGPIIENEELHLIQRPIRGGKSGTKEWFAEGREGHEGTGPTPLIAAMRCYVASKLGNDVNVPEVL
jgi:hypothetical protein